MARDNNGIMGYEHNRVPRSVSLTLGITCDGVGEPFTLEMVLSAALRVQRSNSRSGLVGVLGTLT
jgi:hypothetical protein